MSQTADFQDSDHQENLRMLVMVFWIEENIGRSGELSNMKYHGMKSDTDQCRNVMWTF